MKYTKIVPEIKNDTQSYEEKIKFLNSIGITVKDPKKVSKSTRDFLTLNILGNNNIKKQKVRITIFGSIEDKHLIESIN